MMSQKNPNFLLIFNSIIGSQRLKYIVMVYTNCETEPKVVG